MWYRTGNHVTSPRIAIIGSGAAGLMAAIAASDSAACLLLTDGPLGRSNSMMAQGGLQLPLPEPESKRLFLEDILRSARVDLDRTLVSNFVDHVAETVELLEHWGLALDRDDAGALVRRSAGGLSEPRIVSVRDQIGPAIVKLLRAKVQGCDLDIRQHTQVSDLAARNGGFVLRTRDEGGAESELEVSTVICCTGGITWREAQRRHHPTTNPHNDNHLLFDRLCALGLSQVHPDFFQYQPFGLVDTAAADLGKCVPESITNFGVRLLDRHGEPIGDIRQDRYALTHRMFEVAREGGAVETEHGPGIHLTLSDVPASTLETVFPKVHQYLERRGGAGQDVLVFPFLHYYLGGLRIDEHCHSDLPGLFLAGEITGGLHGRNRLMGNGITDSLVHGRLAGLSAAAYVRN